MAAENEQNGAYRFGRFELDVRARELRKDGIRLRLQDQPFEVLAMLLERPLEVLTREELRRRLWPDGTFVDFEHGLNAAVKRLRTTLGDNADNPRFVETLHRRGYRFVGQVERSAREESRRERFGASAPSSKRRLAVLPFTSLPGNAGHEYFTDGLREEMITELGRVCAGRLGVIARTSSTLIQRTATRIRDIGEALRIDFVVEGNVRRDGDRVRITVQLIDARNETQLWAESYERHLADCFQVQAEVATKIVHSVAVELLPVSTDVRRVGTRHVDAHQAYLKGRYHWNRPGDTGLVQAIAYFEQAIALDPQFGSAYAALGRAHVSAVDYYLVEPRGALEAARRAAAKALELNPADSEAHLTLAEVGRILEWDWSAAEKAYRTALACNPSNESVHRHYGLFLAARGRTADALAAADLACDLDPLCLVVNTTAAWVRYLARDFDRAIDHCRHTLDMDSRFAPARRLLIAALLAHDGGEAAAELNALARASLDPISLAWLAHAVATLGDTSRAGGMLGHVEDLARERYVSAYHRALAHTAIGDAERALQLLEQASEQRDPAIVNLAVDPRFQALGAETRFKALIEKLALPD